MQLFYSALIALAILVGLATALAAAMVVAAAVTRRGPTPARRNPT